MHRVPQVSLLHQIMTLFRTKMRDINQGSRIIRHHPQDLPRRKRHQTLSRLQHRQRTEQPNRIKFRIPFHDNGIPSRRSVVYGIVPLNRLL